jgi:hypothetical protein
MTVDYVGVIITAAADAAIDNPVRHRRTRLLQGAQLNTTLPV